MSENPLPPHDAARPDTLSEPVLPPRYRLATHERGSPGRQAAEQFVREGFFRTHSACVQTFLPTLLTMTDGDGITRGVVGCRFAAEEPLFLERYLDAPIERVLAEETGARISRAHIVEVGNLSCRNSRAAQSLVGMLPRYLTQLGFVWIAFTATASIRRILRHAGARTLELAVAGADRAAGSDDHWGRYYDNDPRVLAGYLPGARRIPALWRSALEN